MEDIVNVNHRRSISSAALFWTCVLLTVGIGLAISYSSGILGGVDRIEKVPFGAYNWLVIALPPVLFLHLGIAMFFSRNENIYTESGRKVRAWSNAFWVLLFIATAITPFFTFHGMVVASYIVASIAGGLALGTTILMYQQSVGAGVTMTIFTAVMSLIMIYLGYWAFA